MNMFRAFMDLDALHESDDNEYARAKKDFKHCAKFKDINCAEARDLLDRLESSGIEYLQYDHKTDGGVTIFHEARSVGELFKSLLRRPRKLKPGETGLADPVELDTTFSEISVVDLVKGAYEAGQFDKLPIGRSNAVTLTIDGVDKERLAGYFRKKPEFAYEINNGSGIISHEFISDKYDIEVFDSFISMYRIPQNESLEEDKNIKENFIKENSSMNNFASLFEELSKLYEADEFEDDVDVIEDAEDSEVDQDVEDEDIIEIVDDEDDSAEDAAESEEDSEEPEEETQVVIECSKCGALVVKAEADTVVDAETDLVNVEDACQFCEEAAGYKIIGVLTPYETAESSDEVESEEELDEALHDAEDAINDKVEEPASDDKDVLTEMRKDEVDDPEDPGEPLPPLTQDELDAARKYRAENSRKNSFKKTERDDKINTGKNFHPGATAPVSEIDAIGLDNANELDEKDS